jgi:uncharacterized membrane protein
MQKIELSSILFKGNGNIWRFVLRQILYIVAGIVLSLILSWVSFVFLLPKIRTVTFQPMVTIPALFGLLYGSWVGLLSGLIGKTLSDVVADWGFYWFGSLAYGLVGFIPSLMTKTINNWKSKRAIWNPVFAGVLGVLAGGVFLSVAEALAGGVGLRDAISSYFMPEFVGNPIVVIMLLPLLLLVLAGIARRGNS